MITLKDIVLEITCNDEETGEEITRLSEIADEVMVKVMAYFDSLMKECPDNLIYNVYE